MTRILIFLIWIVFFAGTITYFASLEDRITGEAFGYKIDGPSGLILGGLFAAFLVAIYLTHKIKDIIAIPSKIRVKDAETKRERGIAALTRGLEAVAVGDASAAEHHAKLARRHLDDLALTRLLTAQAAQLSGDKLATAANFSAMLDSPETEFLGLKGLYLQALSDNDLNEARQCAERAFRLRPNARWAFDAIMDLSLDRGDWAEARRAIDAARRNALVSDETADRGAAALLTADAYAALLGDDESTALNEAEAALKLAPAFAPAAVLAAKLCRSAGKTGKGARFIEAAFTKDPHPALIGAFDALYDSETPERRAARLVKLAEKNADSREAMLLKAHAAILREDWDEAGETLEPFLRDAPTVAAFSLMAQAVAGKNGVEAGRPWLERAANAPRDPRPGADGQFNLTRDGWARLVREYMDAGRLAPPPLEDIADGLSSDEIRLLSAPPPAAASTETAPDVADDENAGTLAADTPEAGASEADSDAVESTAAVAVVDKAAQKEGDGANSEETAVDTAVASDAKREDESASETEEAALADTGSEEPEETAAPGSLDAETVRRVKDVERAAAAAGKVS
ncbi:MAG: heme biosynthesis HemY N-terminal domain-containing protein [Pseudomonadota bacterium]